MTRAALIAVLAASTLVVGCSAGGSDRVGGERNTETRELTLLNPFESPEEALVYTSEVDRLSRGTLRIRVVPSGHTDQLDFEAAMIRDMRRGRADLALVASRAWDEFGVHRLRALNAPLLIDSYALQQRVLTSDLVAPMLGELRTLNLVGVGVLPGAIRHPLGFGHRLASPADFDGLRIGAQQSRVADAYMRALGARPVRLSSQVPSVTGLDGVELRAVAIDGDHLDSKGSRLMTNVDLWPRPLVLFASTKSFRTLTEPQRRILAAAALNAVPLATNGDKSGETEAAGNICRRGDAVFEMATPAELRALHAAALPVYRELDRDPATRDAIDAIERVKARLAAPATTLPACHHTPTPLTSGATPVDGVWSMTTDRRAAIPEYFDENWGDWIYVFDRGRFAITQENRRACTWGYGTYTIADNRMTWDFTDGGGIAPNGATNKPGEHFVFGLSSYRDTLTLTPVKGEISPGNFRAKPWRRLSSTPTRRYFSKRCPPPAAALTG